MNTEKNVYTLCMEHPALREFLISHGFSPLRQDIAFQTMGKMISLRQALATKGIDEEIFLSEYENYRAVAGSEEGTDNAVDASATRRYLAAGSLPCPVKLPLTDHLNAYNKVHHVHDIDFDFRSANLGLDFVTERLLSGKEAAYPDLISSAGYELIINSELHSVFATHYTAPELPFNREMQTKLPGLRDPKGLYRIIAVVPAVFIVNKRALNGRQVPRSWEELLSGDFRHSVAIPVSDLDMHNALVLTIYSHFGVQGLAALKECFAKSLHPAQMVKGMQNQAPSVSIAPYFFASMIANDNQELVWPEEGAVASPILMTVRRESEAAIASVIDYLLSNEVNHILSFNGKFPVTSPSAGPQLAPEQQLLFAGWDMLHEISRELPVIEKYFALNQKG